MDEQRRLRLRRLKRGGLAAAGVVVMVAGVLGSIVAGRTLSEQAYTAWHGEADRQTRTLTQYFDDLMLDARTVVRALSAQVSRDSAVTPFMFRTTLELAQDPEAMFQLQEAAFVQRASRERRDAVEEQVGRPLHQVGNGAADAPDAYEHFAVVVATDGARMLTVGADLGTEPALRAAVATAYRRPNEVVASPVFERGGQQWLALAERPVFPGQRDQTGMIVTLVDFGAVVTHVRNQTSPGIHLYMTQRETDWDPVTHIEDVTTPPANADAAIETLQYRLVHGQARLTLDWFVFDSFEGGPATALGTVVMLAGTALTLLFGTLVAVLALQNDAIRQRVKTRTRQVEAARDEAETANRYKSEFLASVSHELRTPLNAIIGFSELIMRELRGPVGQPGYRDYAQDIHTSGRHLLGVINSIIDLSAIESGHLLLNEAPLDLAETVDSASRIIALQAEKRGVALACEVPPALPRLFADRIAIEQILLNLGANAVQFTPRGGTVTFACGQTGDAIWLSVTDTGVGMDPAEVARAMQPFGQVVSPLRRVSDGAGLGLPIAKELATRHGGAFDVDSRPGNGTRIRILFDSSRTLKPAADAAAQAVA